MKISFRFGRVSLLGAALCASWSMAAAGAELPRTGPTSQLARAQPALRAGLGFTWLGVRVDQPLGFASGSLVKLSLAYSGGGAVSSVQVAGSGAYPLGPVTGGFETALDVDLRILLRREEPQMLARCKALLDPSPQDTIETAYDVVLPLSLVGPDAIPVASINVPYQFGLRCRKPPPPLAATLGFTRLEVNVNQPLAMAGGGQAPFSVTYHGEEAVASIQFSGYISLPLARHGSFSQSYPVVDLRGILQPDEAAILQRCRAGAAERFDTVHDARIPVTVNRANGSVIATTLLNYQIGLTCQK